ncbi:hypothetical protein LCGC14_0449090 [marine sediment metagenome]|uniref:Uncharacterized protein n=1 Tax=marine sediment metagenome TaxID=412755 RepID=A0A0F9VSH7_9ZZZZ
MAWAIHLRDKNTSGLSVSVACTIPGSGIPRRVPFGHTTTDISKVNCQHCLRASLDDNSEA